MKITGITTVGELRNALKSFNWRTPVAFVNGVTVHFSTGEKMDTCDLFDAASITDEDTDGRRTDCVKVHLSRLTPPITAGIKAAVETDEEAEAAGREVRFETVDRVSYEGLEAWEDDGDD